MRFALASLLLVAACSAPDDPAAVEQATITDSSGITIVQNHRPVWGEGEGWKVSAEPVLVIADTLATGDGQYVMNAARLSNGEVVILTDVGGRWFGADGKLLRKFAVQGEGPGEFRHADQLVVLPGDTVVVGQPGSRGKLAWFAPDGSLARDSKVDAEKMQAFGRWSECYNLLLPDLSTTGCKQDSSIPASPTNRSSFNANGEYVGAGPGLLRELRQTYRITPTIDSIYKLGFDISIEQQLVDLPGGQHTSLRHPYHARSFLAAGGDPMQVARATNPHWEIEVWTADGKLIRKIRRDGGRRAPTPIEVAESDVLINDSTGFYVRAEPGVPWQTLRDLLETPDSLPGHSGLLMTSDGMVLSQQTPYFVLGAPTLFDVLDPDGRWLGSIELPPRTRLVHAGPDFLVGVQRDVDDVSSVVVYGLER